ncbi:MAG TPA: 30S ribosomal protein S18 [Thermomicrobiales bacterium]|nr:30S ribosomal protein S18 [Thermomicrobiales bacterium]
MMDEGREDRSARGGEPRREASGRPRFGAGAQGGRGGDGDGGDRSRGRRPGGGAGGGGRFQSRRKACMFCVDRVEVVDYKDIARLRRHLAERGKIEPRRKLGTCARHQRSMTVAIKRARHVALLPFTTGGGRG